MSGALETVKSFYALLKAGDAPAALGLCDIELEWTESENTPYYAGTLRGVAEVVSKVLIPIGDDFDDFAATADEFVAQEDKVAAFGTYTGISKKTGHALKAPFVHSWTVSHGRLRRFVQYTDTVAWKQALCLT